jgi:hypothetical protein
MNTRGVRSRDAATGDERRALGQRVHFEAMVAVGGAEGGAAFEAESVDVSDQGMRLRTAYLPQLGDQLVCRFDGPDGEVVAVGEVLWATEQAKGGEFGLRFIDLDPETEAALKALSASDDAVAEEEAPAPAVNKGARVRLHIEGLASPMKARVRDSDSKEICVGSSLEFLKLGRTVAVEDVDAGDRREGFVDGVKVEIDAATSVPQLVVSLRFDAAEVGMARSEKKSAAADMEPAPATKIAGNAKADQESEPRPSKREPASEPKPSKKAVAAVEVASDSDDDDDMMLPPNKLRQAQDKAKELTSKAAASIGPAFSKMGSGARGFFASLGGSLAKVQKQREETRRANAPKRVTAPPPSGALTSEGRRVVRDGGKDNDEEMVMQPPKKSKKGIAVGAAAGLALVIGIVGITKAMGGKEEPAAQKPAISAAQQVAGMPPIPGQAATADIPLFGPTPLSTTVQLPKAPVAAATAKADAADEEAGDEDAGEKTALVREWGNGEVKNSKTLRVKLDGPVEGFSAKEIDGGFTLTIPKRKSKSTSSALVRKDKRLAAVDVVNNDAGVEITVKFKGDAPGYKAKVREDKIEIALSGGPASDKSDEKKADKKGDPKKVAKKVDPKKKKKKPGPN